MSAPEQQQARAKRPPLGAFMDGQLAHLERDVRGLLVVAADVTAHLKSDAAAPVPALLRGLRGLERCLGTLREFATRPAYQPPRFQRSRPVAKRELLAAAQAAREHLCHVLAQLANDDFDATEVQRHLGGALDMLLGMEAEAERLTERRDGAT